MTRWLMVRHVLGNLCLLATILFLTAGCATMKGSWEDALSANTIEAYEAFLREYPQSEYAPQAWSRIEALYFQKAKDTDTIAAYEDFLRRYPQGRFASVARSWLEVLYLKKAQDTDTIYAYEEFLRRYPKSEFAGLVRSRLEPLYLKKAKDTNTIEVYEDFLKRYPKGALTAQARAALNSLKDQIRQVEAAAKRVLPKEAKVEVTTLSRFPKKPEFRISAHLLEGHSADETSPYVRGDYGTHEKLTRLVRYRCAKVIKSVVTGAKLPDASEICIQARHGVRQYTVGVYSPFGDGDVAMTIYQVSISIDEIKKYNWSSIKFEQIMKLWKVDNNIIPSLEFQTAPF